MASSKWWYCDQCGFANHPRDPRAYNNTKINESCEQCGASQLAGLDFKPTGAA